MNDMLPEQETSLHEQDTQPIYPPLTDRELFERVFDFKAKALGYFDHAPKSKADPRDEAVNVILHAIAGDKFDAFDLKKPDDWADMDFQLTSKDETVPRIQIVFKKPGLTSNFVVKGENVSSTMSAVTMTIHIGDGDPKNPVGYVLTKSGKWYMRNTGQDYFTPMTTEDVQQKVIKTINPDDVKLIIPQKRYPRELQERQWTLPLIDDEHDPDATEQLTKEIYINVQKYDK